MRNNYVQKISFFAKIFFWQNIFFDGIFFGKIFFGKIFSANCLFFFQKISMAKFFLQNIFFAKFFRQTFFSANIFWIHFFRWNFEFGKFFWSKILFSATFLGGLYFLKMSLWQLGYVQKGPRNLPLKFGQNLASKSWDIADMDKRRKDKCCMDKCGRVKCCLDKYHSNSWHLLKMVLES